MADRRVGVVVLAILAVFLFTGVASAATEARKTVIYYFWGDG